MANNNAALLDHEEYARQQIAKLRAMKIPDTHIAAVFVNGLRQLLRYTDPETRAQIIRLSTELS